MARVAHIMLKAGSDMPYQEALDKFEEWKAEIGTDPEKFSQVAMRESGMKIVVFRSE